MDKSVGAWGVELATENHGLLGILFNQKIFKIARMIDFSSPAPAPKAQPTLPLGRGTSAFGDAFSRESFLEALARYGSLRLTMQQEERSLARHRREQAELEARWPMLALASISLGQDRSLQGQIPRAEMATLATRTSILTQDEQARVASELAAQRIGEPAEPPTKRRREEGEPLDPTIHPNWIAAPPYLVPREVVAGILGLPRSGSFPAHQSEAGAKSKTARRKEKEKKKAEEQKKELEDLRRKLEEKGDKDLGGPESPKKDGEGGEGSGAAHTIEVA